LRGLGLDVPSCEAARHLKALRAVSAAIALRHGHWRWLVLRGVGAGGRRTVNQIIDQIVQFLQQGIAWIFNFFKLIWTWSFGQMIAIFQSDWQSLPLWKILVLVVVVIGIIYVLYKAVLQLWEAAEKILKAFIGLLSVLVTILPYILIAGLIAAGGSWVIQNVNF
jgi:hypothetical protein